MRRERQPIFWVLFFLSAVTYCAAFLFSSFCYPLVFFFPAILASCATRKRIDFWYGYLWALIVCSIQLFGVCLALARMKIPLWVIVLIPFYAALFGGIAFCLSEQIAQFLRSSTFLRSNQHVLSVVGGVFLFIFFITRISLAPFGRLEGYSMMHPLIPLMGTPLTSVIYIFGSFYTTILWGCAVLSSALFVTQRSKLYFFSVIAVCLIWISCFFYQPSKENGKLLRSEQAKWCVLPHFFSAPSNLSGLFSYLNQTIQKVQHIHPQRTIFLLPEGAIGCTLDMSVVQQIPELMFDKGTTELLFGTACWNNGCTKNVICVLKNGTLITMYEKRHTMVLTERLLFGIAHGIEVRPSREEHKKIRLGDRFYVPYICSELFFNETADDQFSDTPIIAFCNDLWFSRYGGRYIQDLMEKTAQFRAISWNRDIFYIAYSRALFLGKSGEKIPLFITNS